MKNFEKIVEFIKEIGANIQIKIGELESFSELKGIEKKVKLDEYIINMANKGIDKLPIRLYQKMILRYIVNNFMPVLTQISFNFIQSKIKGVTK